MLSNSSASSVASGGLMRGSSRTGGPVQGFSRVALRKAKTASRRLEQLRQPARRGYKSVARQLLDILRARLRGRPLTFDEYYDFGLFDGDRYPDSELRRFGGLRSKEDIHAELCDVRWEGMVTDKFIQYSLLKSFSLPHPPVRALVNSHDRATGAVPAISSESELAQFLDMARLPLFCKPVKGSYGQGSFRIDEWDTAMRQVGLAGGEVVTLAAFGARLHDDNGLGYLIQDAARPDEALRPLIGDTFSGCRFLVIRPDSGPVVFRAVWKLPRRDAIVDNFSHGDAGGLIAGVDPTSGVVLRVTGGRGLGIVHDCPHPETGVDLVGVKVPRWDEMVELVVRAAACFPGFLWQHWDIGISEDGPVIFELNSAGNTDSAQRSYGRGIFDAQLTDFLNEYGSRGWMGGPCLKPTNTATGET